jgi:hypothetical protein
MRRAILGLLAIGMFTGALAIGRWLPGNEGATSFCWRFGAIAAAAWLAYDDVQRLPGWLLLVVSVSLVVLARWPRLLWVIFPLLILWAVVWRFLRPPGGQHGQGPPPAPP